MTAVCVYWSFADQMPRAWGTDAHILTHTRRAARTRNGQQPTNANDSQARPLWVKLRQEATCGFASFQPPTQLPRATRQADHLQPVFNMPQAQSTCESRSGGLREEQHKANGPQPHTHLTAHEEEESGSSRRGQTQRAARKRAHDASSRAAMDMITRDAPNVHRKVKIAPK